MKKYKLMLAAPPKLQDLGADIEKISQLAEEEVYIQVVERCSDIEQLNEWISGQEKEELDFLLLFNLVEDRINQEQGSLEILEALRTIRFSTHSKIIIILAQKHESSAIWLNFVNELMKLDIQNFYFTDEFTTEDLKFWLEQKKTLSDNQKYIRVGNDSSAKEQELEKHQKEIQEEKKQLQEKELELEQLKLQMQQLQEQIEEAKKEKEKEQPLIMQGNPEPQEAQAQEQTQAEINALQQKWEEERQKILQQSRQEKEELLQKSRAEKEQLLKEMQDQKEEKQKTEEPKESRLPPFMGGIFIGVMNLSHGAGSTMTAVKIADYLAVFGKTAVIVFDGKEDLLYADKKLKVDYIIPSIGRKKEELVKALRQGYSFVLLDFGKLLDISPSGQINSSYLVDRKEDVEEFLRCQYKIVFSFTESWHIGKLQYFQKNENLFDLEHFLFVLSGENSSELKQFRHQICSRNSDDLIKTLGSQMGLQIEQKKRRGK